MLIQANTKVEIQEEIRVFIMSICCSWDVDIEINNFAAFYILLPIQYSKICYSKKDYKIPLRKEKVFHLSFVMISIS